MGTKKLTEQQEKFCQAYVKTGNATASFRGAFNTSNMKPATINRRACVLSKIAKIVTRCAELHEQSKNVANIRFQIDEESILKQLDILRNSRIDDYIEIANVRKTTTDKKGNKTTQTVQELRFKPFNKLTPEQKMCIESIRQTRDGRIELKLHGKEWTIEKINRHIGFYDRDGDQKKKIFDSPEKRAERLAILKDKLNKITNKPPTGKA